MLGFQINHAIKSLINTLLQKANLARYTESITLIETKNAPVSRSILNLLKQN